MKKVLSILLAVCIAFSCTVAAGAAAPKQQQQRGLSTYKQFKPALYSAEPTAQSLTYELPVVTDIQGVWSGETLLYPYDLHVWFNEENMDVTVTFEDGTTQALTYWYDEGRNWFWEVFYDYNAFSGEVILYYIDSNLYEAYIDTLEDPEEDYVWEDLAKTLPQCSLMVPANLIKSLVESKTVPALKLNETAKAKYAVQDYQIFKFTPETNGAYYFVFENHNDDRYPLAILTDSAFEPIDYADDYVFFPLEAGKVYYLFITEYIYDLDEQSNCDVTVTQLDELNPVLKWIYTYLLGGWFWLEAIVLNGQYLLPGMKQFGLLFQMIKILIDAFV